jgi:serine/threonine protein phosphatase PrpC
VADGVGGYSGAKRASSIAVEMLEKDASEIRDEISLRKSTEEIHGRILDEAATLHFPNMGTTLALVKFFPKTSTILVGNIGDSPVLLFRNGSMSSIYHDDSYRSIDSKSMSGIIQYLGVQRDLDIHTRIFPVVNGDTILLCSDGVTDNFLNLDEGEAQLASLASLRDAEKIVDTAIQIGIKPDDMSVVVLVLES